MIAAIALALTFFAQPLHVNCAISYIGEPPARVIVTLGGPAIEAEAGFCADRIASGQWEGVSNLGEWKPSMRPLALMWPKGDMSTQLDVWTSYDWQSRVFGTGIVEAFRDPTNSVEILYVNPPSN